MYLTETVVVAEKVTSFSSDVCGGNGCLTVQDASNIDHPKGYQQHDRSSKTDPSALSGIERRRTTLGEEQPSVCVIYNNLNRERVNISLRSYCSTDHNGVLNL